MYNETIQPPETNAKYLGWGPSLLGAEFVRGRDVPESHIPVATSDQKWVRYESTRNPSKLVKHLHQAIPQYSIKNAPDESCTVLEEVEWKMAVIVGSISAALNR